MDTAQIVLSLLLAFLVVAGIVAAIIAVRSKKSNDGIILDQRGETGNTPSSIDELDARRQTRNEALFPEDD